MQKIHEYSEVLIVEKIMRSALKKIQAANESMDVTKAVSARRHLLSLLFIISCANLLVVSWWTLFSGWAASIADGNEFSPQLISISQFMAILDRYGESYKMGCHILVWPALFTFVIFLETLVMTIKRKVTTMFGIFVIIVCVINLFSLIASLFVAEMISKFEFNGLSLVPEILKVTIGIEGLLLLLYCAVYVPIAKYKGWQY